MSNRPRDNATIARVSLDRLRAHPRNVRHDLGDLRELTASIADSGVLVPLMAERRGDHLRLLHGHRRAAAARIAKLRSVPCVVVDEHEDLDAIALMVVENGPARLGLSAEEKRDAVNTLHNEFGLPHVEIADRFGVSLATVYAWKRGPDDEAPVRQLDTAQRSTAPRRPSSVVARRRVVDVVTRWDGTAPPELLAELRALLGDDQQPHAGTEAVAS